MKIEIVISRDKAIKCSNYLHHLVEEYAETEQQPEDDVYFGLGSIAKQLGKAVERSDKGL